MFHPDSNQINNHPHMSSPQVYKYISMKYPDYSSHYNPHLLHMIYKQYPNKYEETHYSCSYQSDSRQKYMSPAGTHMDLQAQVLLTEMLVIRSPLLIYRIELHVYSQEWHLLGLLSNRQIKHSFLCSHMSAFLINQLS